MRIVAFVTSINGIDAAQRGAVSDWSTVVVNALPSSRTVTLLSAGVDGCAPGSKAPTPARLGRAITAVVTAHRGVHVAEPDPHSGEFVVCFACASDAVSCALELQRAPSVPRPLHIGVHTGEVHARDDTGYAGSTLDRATRLRDLADAGQTLLSGVTADLIADRLPADSWLTELGSCATRNQPRLERVVQACHRDLRSVFPPLRASDAAAGGAVPAALTSFVGRQAELGELQALVAEHRLVTLTGSGGVGKTRLAAELATGFGDGLAAGACWVDLAPISDENLVAVAVTRALGLPDQPSRSATEIVIRFIAGRQMLLVLDNCEHLLDACATLASALLSACPHLTVLSTSREPIGVAGEVVWCTPSLSLADEAVELFTDRARLARPDFSVTADNATTVAEICRRLDGVPLAIELAAARVRAWSLPEISDGLRDRLRLLTGGARTAVPRQQTLRASVDWSHALLSEPERRTFRRLAVFVGGFDLAAATAVADVGSQHDQILDELTLLVDKSLVVTDNTRPVTRYRMLETVRQYALEKLDESGETPTLRTRHRDHYTGLFDVPIATGVQQRIEQAEVEIDNLRAAFAWSREHGDAERAARLASALQPLWLRGRIVEGLAWFDTVLADGAALTPAVRARALADKTILDHFTGAFDVTDQIEPALTIARDLDDPTLLAQVLTARGAISAFSPDVAVPYFNEGSSSLARWATTGG